MQRSIKSNQRQERELAFSVDGSVPSLVIGNGLGTLVENSDGDYTITFNQPFARIPIVLATAITDVTTVRIKEKTKFLVTLEQVGADQTTPVADGDFDVVVKGWDTATETSIL